MFSCGAQLWFSEAFLQSCDGAFVTETIQKEMKIDEAGVGFPGSEEFPRFFVAGTFVEAKVLLEFVPAADVVTGENIQAAHAAKQRVFGGPSADSANCGETCEGGGVVEIVERFEIQFAGDDGSAEFKDGAFLLLAVAHGAQSARRNGCHILRGRAGPPGRAGVESVGRRRRGGFTESLHEAIEKHDADVKRNLLTGDSVEQGLENCGVAGRLETGELSDQRPKMLLRCRERVEGAEIDLRSEEALNFAAQNYFGAGGKFFCGGSDGEAGTRRRADLSNREFDDDVFDCERATICLTVPTIEKIFRAAAKNPRSKVKTERRCWTHLERDRVERKRGADSGGSWHSFLWTFSAFDIIYRIEMQCKCSDEWLVTSG